MHRVSVPFLKNFYVFFFHFLKFIFALPHCPPNLAVAIASTTMPKGKRQSQQQPPPPQQPPREETGDEEDGSPIALHGGPPGSRGPMIPPLLSLPPPPRGRCPIRGGLGPRCGPYGRGWWGANTGPPFPGPGHGGPSRGGFHKEQRNPRRLKSWSLIKNTCPPKDGPQVMEDKSNRPDTLPQRVTVDMRTSVPSTTQASMDLLCETVPSHLGWKEPSVT
uniref:Uncharacterized protein n=1 Tax=Felis catus TaxID=9685 RepID=A0ABI7YY92_FELCA